MRMPDGTAQSLPAAGPVLNLLQSRNAKLSAPAWLLRYRHEVRLGGG